MRRSWLASSSVVQAPEILMRLFRMKPTNTLSTVLLKRCLEARMAICPEGPDDIYSARYQSIYSTFSVVLVLSPAACCLLGPVRTTTGWRWRGHSLLRLSRASWSRPSEKASGCCWTRSTSPLRKPCSGCRDYSRYVCRVQHVCLTAPMLSWR